MRSATLVGASVVAALLGGATPAFAQDTVADLSAHGARTLQAKNGASLARPGLGRAAAVHDALRDRHDDATLRGLVQSREHESGGVVHLTFTQQAAGLDVFGTYVKATFSAGGDLVHVVENLVSGQRAASARASAGTSRAAGGAGTLLPRRLRRARRAVGRRQRRHVPAAAPLRQPPR